MKTLPEVEHAMEVSKNQSEVSYRRGKEELHHYNVVPDRPDFISAANAAKLASNVAYKSNSKQPVYSDGSVLTRNDILHAKEVSKLASQVKYKESFERDLRGQKPCYNPLDCLSFRHTQAAAALASQVKYRTSRNQRPEGSSDLPNLLQLEHVLKASKLQSNVGSQSDLHNKSLRFCSASGTCVCSGGVQEEVRADEGPLSHRRGYG
uniref:Uncharacterized protein n=1 Tax=Iconisemion striatum TaxID=60296 RepID=A0A1A7XE56_9TELE